MIRVTAVVSVIEGIPKDLVQAVGWYRKAADLGYPTAQHQLGIAYRGGMGVPRDIDEALSWYRKAAEQGGDLQARCFILTSQNLRAEVRVVSLHFSWCYLAS